MPRFAITERSRKEQQHILTGTRKGSQWVHQVQEKDVVCGCNSLWRCSEAVLGCILDTCTSCCPTSRLNKEPRNGNRHHWFTGKGLLQVCSKRSWRDIPLYLADSRQDMAAILAVQGIRRLPFVGGADNWLTVSYQGNPQLGHISHSPPQINDLRLTKGRCNVTESKFTLLAT